MNDHQIAVSMYKMEYLEGILQDRDVYQNYLKLTHYICQSKYNTDLIYKSVENGTDGHSLNIKGYIISKSSPDQAKELYQQSVELNNPYGMFNLAAMYETMLDESSTVEDIAENCKIASELYAAAHQAGHPIAYTSLILLTQSMTRKVINYYELSVKKDS